MESIEVLVGIEFRGDNIICSRSYRNIDIQSQKYESVVDGLVEAYEIWRELLLQDSSLKRLLDICDSIVYEEFLSENEVAILDAIVDGVQQMAVDVVRGVSRKFLQEEIETLNTMFWEAIIYFANK